MNGNASDDHHTTHHGNRLPVRTTFLQSKLPGCGQINFTGELPLNAAHPFFLLMFLARAVDFDKVSNGKFGRLRQRIQNMKNFVNDDCSNYLLRL